MVVRLSEHQLDLISVQGPHPRGPGVGAVAVVERVRVHVTLAVALVDVGELAYWAFEV